VKPDTDPAEGEDLLRLDHQVCFPLYAATNLMQRLYRPLLEPLGLTYAQYLVMLLLWAQAPMSVGKLRACLHLDIGTLSPLLKRMERSGLITRRRDADDERRVLVALTPLGCALRDRARSIPAELSRKTGMRPRQVDDLRERVQTLVTQLAGAQA
jgi:DNA-binding MarR family transcriptional regulator